jgi:tRNA pseudouridine55 synthase
VRFGLLNVRKPAGVTSRQVVDVVQRLVEPAKAGHAGTLDPLATGVLVVCVGAATRLIPLVQQQRKVYRAEFLLGLRSDTDDVTGTVVETAASPVSREELESVLPQFVGSIAQVPPQFSAVKIAGRRAYDLARQGEAVDIEAKTVEVHRLDTQAFAWPRWEVEVECGSGTYVRSIGRDVGEVLGCGAVMSALVRTRIGPFGLADAVAADELTAETLNDRLLPASLATVDLPQYAATEAECVRLRNGLTLRGLTTATFADDDQVAVHSPSGRPVCLAHYRHRDRSLAPKQVFPPA